MVAIILFITIIIKKRRTMRMMEMVISALMIINMKMWMVFEVKKMLSN